VRQNYGVNFAIIKQANPAFCKQTRSALQRKTWLENKQKAMCKYMCKLNLSENEVE